jgi:hypothetical protein
MKVIYVELGTNVIQAFLVIIVIKLREVPAIILSGTAEEC